MDIKDIAKMYGKTDYYEMMTGRIFKLSKATYSKETDTTIVPIHPLKLNPSKLNTYPPTAPPITPRIIFLSNPPLVFMIWLASHPDIAPSTIDINILTNMFSSLYNIWICI